MQQAAEQQQAGTQEPTFKIVESAGTFLHASQAAIYFEIFVRVCGNESAVKHRLVSFEL